MFIINTYMDALIFSLKEHFEDRLLYVGLQGSYLRGEATEDSDLDVMVVVDALLMSDLDAYKRIIEGLYGYEKTCGFICGQSELRKWNPLEICHLLHGTKDFYGSLSDFVPTYKTEDIINFIKLSIGNLYHEICHRYLHGSVAKNKAKLPSSFKSVFFILQNLYYLKDGVFYPSKMEMVDHLQGIDKTVLEMSMQLKQDTEYDFESTFDILFTWCKETMQKI